MSLRRIFILLLIAAFGALVLRSFVIEGIYVATASMEPTLKVGSKFLLEKVTLAFRPVREGEIVVFQSPMDRDRDLIKRVIAIAGDEIEIRDKDVYVNGSKLSENYTKHTRQNEVLVGDNLGPLKVPPGCVFVLGDNRDESQDSRDWKDTSGKPMFFVNTTNLRGRLLFLF